LTGLEEKPLVSIITVCFNSEKHIKDAIASILNQTYPHIEHIIVDGQSTDNTLGIIKEFEPEYKGRMKLISEKDEGIYDAFNKGIKLSRGVLIGILNSDDWYSRKAIEVVVNNFEEDIDIYHGKMYHVRKIGDIYYKKNDFINDLSLITEVMSINHPTCFVHRRWYDKKMYDHKFKISADYKFILDSYLSGAKFKYIDYYFTYMRIGGASSGSLKGALEGYYIKKELLGKNKTVTLIKRILTIAYYKFRKSIAVLVLPKKHIEYYETKNWITINKEEMDNNIF